MFKRYFQHLFLKNKEFILAEALAINGFMQLLMKHRNTGVKWTREEKRQLKDHLKTIALIVPAVIVFLPPGGGLLLPILVDVLDRRKTARRSQPSAQAPNTPGTSANNPPVEFPDAHPTV